MRRRTGGDNGLPPSVASSVSKITRECDSVGIGVDKGYHVLRRVFGFPSPTEPDRPTGTGDAPPRGSLLFHDRTGHPTAHIQIILMNDTQPPTHIHTNTNTNTNTNTPLATRLRPVKSLIDA